MEFIAEIGTISLCRLELIGIIDEKHGVRKTRSILRVYENCDAGFGTTTRKESS